MFWPTASGPIVQGNMTLTTVRSNEVESNFFIREFEISPVKSVSGFCGTGAW